MRYYVIYIINPATGAVEETYTSWIPPSGGRPGQTDLGALNIELDISVASQHVPASGAWVRIWGIPISAIGQANKLKGKKVKIFAGMVAGLPLANPAQAGLLVEGEIWNPFGNWQGTDQTLEFFVVPSPATQRAPANFTFNWPQGTAIASAIGTALTAGLPGVAQAIAVNPQLIAPETVTGFYATLGQFASFLNETTKAIIGGDYRGLSTVLSAGTIRVFDGTTAPKNTTIQFTDMIGQATFIAYNEISLKTVLRADISVGDYLTLPPGQIATTAQSMAALRQGSVFQGQFVVETVRHIGNFRQPSGDGWCTIFTAAGPV